MQTAIEVIKEIFRTSFNLRLLVVSIIVMAAIIIVSLGLSVVLAAGIIGSIFAGGEGAIIASILIGILVMTILLVGVTAILQGGIIIAVAETLEKKKIDFIPPFKKALARAVPLIGVFFVISILEILVLVLTLAPFVSGITAGVEGIDFNTLGLQMDALGEDATEEEVYSILLREFEDILYPIATWLGLYSVIEFLLYPFFIMMVPFVILGNRKVLDAVKEGFHAGKKEYSQNLLVLLPVYVVSMIMGIASVIVSEIGYIAGIYMMVLYWTAGVKLYKLRTEGSINGL